MARQGYRVWAARLAVGCVLIAVGALAAVHFLMQEFAEKSSRGIESASQRVPENVVPTDVHPLDPLLDFARTALRHHAEKHRDYTALLTKQELVNGKLQPESKMALKLKYGDRVGPESPRSVSVYLKTLEPKFQAGREVIWVQGRNDDKITAHEAGLLGLVTLNLKPDSRLAMAGNRYPITEIGIEKLLGKLIEKGERDRKLGPATVRITENVALGDKQCRLMEVTHESPSTTIDGKLIAFEFFLAQIYIDDEHLIPLKYASYSWPKTQDGPPELLEAYTYQDLVLNVGLNEIDFDPKNSAYGF